MRDPYDVLGLKRGASYEEVKAAFKRLSMQRHPDRGGSHEAMVELNIAYAWILKQFKDDIAARRDAKSAGRQQGAKPGGEEQARQEERQRRDWQDIYADIDDELDRLRRQSAAHEEALRRMRDEAWSAGDRVAWARLTWAEFADFIRRTARSGLKGVALLVSALMGIGAVLLETNVVSGLIMLGAGFGLFASVALKNDKGGMMSAALLLFGLMTLWLPPVRYALFTFPLATVSVLALLALIYKFAQVGGTAGLMTGGILALYVLGVVVAETDRSARMQQVARREAAPQPSPRPAPAQQAPVPAQPSVAPPEKAPAAVFQPPRPPPATVSVAPPSAPVPPPVPPAPEPRQLRAAQDSLLKINFGIPYRFLLRTGMTTRIVSTQGTVAFFDGDRRVGDCVASLEFTTAPGRTPWTEAERFVRACDDDALLRVAEVR